MKLALLTAVSMLSVCSLSALADVKLPAIFSENMVLQRGMPIPVWGWTDPGAKVTVQLGDDSAPPPPPTRTATGAWTARARGRRAGRCS